MQRLLDIRSAPSQTRDLPGLPHKSRPVSLLVLLTVLVAVAYGLWGYLSYAGSRERAALTAEVNQLQRDRRTANSTAPDKEALARREAVAQGAMDGHTDRLFGSAQGVLAVATVSALAEQFGVFVQDLTAAEPQAADPDAKREPSGARVSRRQPQQKAASAYDSIGMSLTVTGEPHRVLGFAEALQSGIVPGVALQRLSVEGTTSLRASLTLDLYTWPSKPADAPPPSPFAAVGPLATRPSPAILRVGDPAAPLLAWGVQANGGWPEALRSVTATVTAPPGSLQALVLYAEASGDENLDLGRDRLIASASVRPDQPVTLRPHTPYLFNTGQPQRFYLVGRVSGIAPTGQPVEVSIAPGGIAFGSSVWPRPHHAEAFSAKLTIRIAPLAEAAVLRAEPDTGTVLPLKVAPSDGRPSLRVVREPSHGSVSLDGGRGVYTPRPGFVGQDSFTYLAEMDGVESAPATVWILVWRSVPYSSDGDSRGTG